MFSLFALISAAVATISLVLMLFNQQQGRRKSGEIKQPTLSETQDCSPAGLSGSTVLKRCWSLIHGMGLQLLPYMTWGYRDRLTRSLRRAGMHGWSCADLCAAQVLLALLSMLIFALLIGRGTEYDLFSFNSAALIFGLGAMSGCWPVLWMHSRRKQRLVEIGRGLPFFLDMVALGLDSGLTLQSAMQLALDHLDSGPLKQEWTQTLFDIRSGLSRADALRQMSLRVELQAIRQLVVALIQGESMGLSLSKTVGEYARQQRQSRLLQAEKLALQAPIKMLFPLAFCIFPCTFLVLGFPVAAILLGLE
jgi:tight adherence protein C